MSYGSEHSPEKNVLGACTITYSFVPSSHGYIEAFRSCQNAKKGDNQHAQPMIRWA